MKTTIIPAQITSVEDKIAGNLSFPQILLMLGALFSVTFIYAVFPQRLQLTAYKLPLMAIATLLFFTLAARIKGKIILEWVIIISSYALRPRYFIYNKNDMLLRTIPLETKPRKEHASLLQKEKIQYSDKLSIADVVTMENILLNPKRNIRYAFKKKGGIHVSVS